MIEINPAPNIKRVVVRVGLLPKISLNTKARKNEPVQCISIECNDRISLRDVVVLNIEANRLEECLLVGAHLQIRRATYKQCSGSHRIATSIGSGRGSCSGARGWRLESRAAPSRQFAARGTSP